MTLGEGVVCAKYVLILKCVQSLRIQQQSLFDCLQMCDGLGLRLDVCAHD